MPQMPIWPDRNKLVYQLGLLLRIGYKPEYLKQTLSESSDLLDQAADDALLRALRIRLRTVSLGFAPLPIH